MTKAAAATKAPDTAGETPETIKPVANVAPLPRDRWRVQESGVFFGTHEILPEAATPFEALASPEYWSNVAVRLKPGHKIVAFAEDGSWYGELLVWGVGTNWAHVAPLGYQSRPDFAPVAGTPEQFEVSWAGQMKKFRVIRKSDRAELKTGLESADDANRWIADHTKALRR